MAEGARRAGMDQRKIFVGSQDQIVEVLKGGLGPGDWVLVKGSRLAAMDNVVKRLRNR